MVIICFFSAAKANSELVESIVAVVNDDVILLSEFKVVMRQAKENGKEVTVKAVIEGMIHNRLLLEQAKKFNFGRNVSGDMHSDPEKVIKNYIDKRIKAMIHIPFRDIETYYLNNPDKYAERDLSDVKSEIEEYLLNMMLEIKRMEHIDELMEEATIRIQLDDQLTIKN